MAVTRYRARGGQQVRNAGLAEPGDHHLGHVLAGRDGRVAQHDPCRTGTRCPAPGRTRPSPRRAWCCPSSRTLHRARPDSSPAPAATARIIPAAMAKAKSRHSPRYHRQSAHPAHGRTAHAVSAIMRAFPRKRLVKSCTKRFRGNADVAAGNTAIPHATLLAADADTHPKGGDA
jgi:hypothetical protein